MKAFIVGTSLVDNNMLKITASTTRNTSDRNMRGREDNPLDPGICQDNALPRTISSIQQPAEGLKDDLSKQVEIHRKVIKLVGGQRDGDGCNTSVMLKAASTIYTLIMNCFADCSNILVWNVRGAANMNIKRHRKDLIRKYHPSLVVLLETHIQFARASNFWMQLAYSPAAIGKLMVIREVSGTSL
jgi:hypothetical protein